MTERSSDLASRYAAVQAAIQAAAASAGRSPDAVSLLAVSKGQPAEQVRALYELGQRDFGENYAQELITKAAELQDLAIRWHFIGHIQSNKLGQLSRTAMEIQTLSSLRHAERLAGLIERAGAERYPVYIEVNASDEAAKSGCRLSEAEALADAIARLGSLEVQGIMAVPHKSYQDPSTGPLVVPELYRELRRVASRVGRGRLSLGMTSDLRLAVAAGSDLVRIGTALFGERASRRPSE